MKEAAKNFVRAGSGLVTQTEPGVTRRVLAHLEPLMLVEFAFEAGAVGPPHSHPHVQASYVAEGRFEVTIGGATETLGRGDTFIVPPDTVHGVKALEAGRLIDSFAPHRAEFLTGS